MCEKHTVTHTKVVIMIHLTKSKATFPLVFQQPWEYYFIDDLPEVLGHPDFPTNAQKILFRSGVLPSIEQNDTGRDLLRQYDSVASVPSPTSRRPAACPQDQTNFYSWVTIANYILEEASCL